MLQGGQGVVQAQVVLQQVQQGLAGGRKGCLDVLHVPAAAVLCSALLALSVTVTSSLHSIWSVQRLKLR